MFLLLYGRHDGGHLHGHQHGVSIQNSVNLGGTPNNARMNYLTDLNLGEVVYISIIFHIPVS